MKTQVGLSEEAITSLVDNLNRLLADTYILYIKTLNCHWNVEDPRFLFLHELFEEQYTSLAKQGDVVAERIRLLGRKVPANMKGFLERGTTEEISGDLSGDEMLLLLAQSHEKLIVQLRIDIIKSEELGDPGTADLYEHKIPLDFAI